MSDIQTLIDHAAITDLVQRWGLCRDVGRWDELRAMYTEDATMHTTWFVGSADEFVKRSMEAARKGAKAQHFIGAATIDLNGDKAIAETRMMLLVRAKLKGQNIDVTCYGRFYDQLIRQSGRWQIKKRVPIYEKDRLDPLDPSCRLELNSEELARYPEGYKHLAYVQASGGADITPGLPTPNSKALSDLYAEAAVWLR